MVTLKVLEHAFENIEQNAQIIHAWLEEGTVEDVGAELILSEVERYILTANLICEVLPVQS